MSIDRCHQLLLWNLTSSGIHSLSCTILGPLTTSGSLDLFSNILEFLFRKSLSLSLVSNHFYIDLLTEFLHLLVPSFLSRSPVEQQDVLEIPPGRFHDFGTMHTGQLKKKINTSKRHILGHYHKSLYHLYI